MSSHRERVVHGCGSCWRFRIAFEVSRKVCRRFCSTVEETDLAATKLIRAERSVICKLSFCIAHGKYAPASRAFAYMLQQDKHLPSGKLLKGFHKIFALLLRTGQLHLQLHLQLPLLFFLSFIIKILISYNR